MYLTRGLKMPCMLNLLLAVTFFAPTTIFAAEIIPIQPAADFFLTASTDPQNPTGGASFYVPSNGDGTFGVPTVTPYAGMIADVDDIDGDVPR